MISSGGLAGSSQHVREQLVPRADHQRLPAPVNKCWPTPVGGTLAGELAAQHRLWRLGPIPIAGLVIAGGRGILRQFVVDPHRTRAARRARPAAGSAARRRELGQLGLRSGLRQRPTRRDMFSSSAVCSGDGTRRLGMGFVLLPVEALLGHVVEVGVELIELALRERIVLMVVALGAGQRRAEKYRGRGRHPVDDVLGQSIRSGRRLLRS